MNRSRRLVPVTVALLVLAASLVPLSGGAGATGLPFGLGLTTLGHLAGYGGLTIALAWGWRVGAVGPLVAVVGVAVAFGVGVELLQSLVPTRQPSVTDALVNGIGATAAAVVWSLGRSNVS
ncbi:VanZ family protein [Haloarcula montana]|uniref:VanZ family protein n=1 Tax=Haloarcula montana TaxID=3111776 RepID=UPI002D783E46|nr:VanZ family protein [Haloarcula sp. GH36]